MTHFPSLDDKLHQNGSMAALFASKSSRPSTMHHGWCSINIYCRKELMNENHENIGTLKKKQQIPLWGKRYKVCC